MHLHLMDDEHYAKMTDAQFSSVKLKLQSVLHKSCFTCGYSRQKQLSRFLLADVAYDNSGKRFVNTQLGPNIKVVCGNCGNILYFDGSSAGLDLGEIIG